MGSSHGYRILQCTVCLPVGSVGQCGAALNPDRDHAVNTRNCFWRRDGCNANQLVVEQSIDDPLLPGENINNSPFSVGVVGQRDCRAKVELLTGERLVKSLDVPTRLPREVIEGPRIVRMT